MKLKPTLSAAIALALTASLAAGSELLKVTHFERTGASTVNILFADSGTGASGYRVESSPDLERWAPQSAIVSPEVAGEFTAAINDATGDERFFRIVAVGGTGGTAIAGMSMSDIVVEEGSGSAQVVVTFSEFYSGPLRYRWNGSIVPGEGGFGSLSGLVQVDGTSATITLAIPDNSTLDEIRQLSISIALGADSGYELGEGAATASITVIDDDATWAGTFQHKGESIQLLVELVKTGASWSGRLLSDGTGLFPAVPGGIPLSSITFSDNLFSAVANGIPVVASEENALCSDVSLRLTLNANAATAGHAVSGEQIVGNASINISKPGSTHLNTTLGGGSFALVRQVVTPPSSEVELEN